MLKNGIDEGLNEIATLRTVSKTFADGTNALSDFSLSIHAGDIVGLIGPNGSGKTTLLKILARQTAQTTGTYHLPGVVTADDFRKVVGFVSQEPALDPEMTSLETLRLFAALYGIKPAEQQLRIDTVINDFSLADFVQQRVAFLSGGQRQRLHLAVALLQMPRLLLLDEPTEALDLQLREQLWQALKKFVSAGERAVLVSTHDIHNLEQHATRLVCLRRGVMVANDTPRAIRGEHPTLAAAYFALTGEELKNAAQVHQNDKRRGKGNGPRGKSSLEGVV